MTWLWIWMYPGSRALLAKNRAALLSALEFHFLWATDTNNAWIVSKRGRREAVTEYKAARALLDAIPINAELGTYTLVRPSGPSPCVKVIGNGPRYAFVSDEPSSWVAEGVKYTMT